MKTERKNFKHMRKSTRDKIEVLYNSGTKIKDIAEILGYSKMSIYREIRKGLYDHKNGDWTYSKRYSADKAQRYADYQCTAKGGPLKIGSDYELIKYIERKILEEKKSPEVILGEIARDNIHFKTEIKSKNTIYSYIDKGLFMNVTNKNLLRRGKCKRKHKKVHTAKRIQKGLSIEDRPGYINELEEFGHWELDTVIGRRKKDYVLFVFTERKTNKEIIMKAPDKTALSCIRCINRLERFYGNKFYDIFKSITTDNGVEFSDTEGIQKSVRRKGRRLVHYYCHPYSSWERGRNECNNSFIRRFIPKGEAISSYSISDIKRIEEYINNYPRKIYNFNSSEMQFLAELQKL